MMPIKASCPRCGGCELHPGQFRLVVPAQSAVESTYSFICPTCRDEVRKPADEAAISLLMRCGVKATVLEIPAEVIERAVPAGTIPAPRLTDGDLDDFRIDLGLHDDLAAHAA
jgi:hypothetical protein